MFLSWISSWKLIQEIGHECTKTLVKMRQTIPVGSGKLTSIID